MTIINVVITEKIIVENIKIIVVQIDIINLIQITKEDIIVKIVIISIEIKFFLISKFKSFLISIRTSY